MTGLQQCLLIAAGGAAGALARFGVGTWISNTTQSGFPWGTFVINVSGSLLLGFLMPLLAAKLLPVPVRPLMAVGFIGAYTTFSTFEYETAQLGSSWRAMGNLLGSVAVGYIAIWIGARLADMTLRSVHGH